MIITHYNALFLFIMLNLQRVCSLEWINVELPSQFYEALAVSEGNEKRLDCGNIDKTTKHKYHWRFNSSSILPPSTQIHKDTISFLKGSNAVRSHLEGRYTCCIKDNLGNACYHRNITLRDRPEQEGVDVTNNNVINGKVGNTYYIRLWNSKRLKAIECKRSDGRQSRLQYAKLGQRVRYYHLKLEHTSEEDYADYNCSFSIGKQADGTTAFVIKKYVPRKNGSASLNYLPASMIYLYLCFTQ